MKATYASDYNKHKKNYIIENPYYIIKINYEKIQYKLAVLKKQSN